MLSAPPEDDHVRFRRDLRFTSMVPISATRILAPLLSCNHRLSFAGSDLRHFRPWGDNTGIFRAGFAVSNEARLRLIWASMVPIIRLFNRHLRRRGICDPSCDTAA